MDFQFSIFNFQIRSREGQATPIASHIGGQAAILGVLFVTAGLLAAALGTAAISIKDTRIAEENARSKRAYFAAEAGAEDAVYRTLRNKNLTPSLTLTLNNAGATTTISTINGVRTIITEGESVRAVRGLEIVLKESTTEAQFFYGIQVGDGGLEMGNNSRVNGNVYSNGNVIGNAGAVITGDVIVAGGVNELPSVEWTSNDGDQFFATTSSSRDIAQSFTATASGALNRIAVFLGKVGSPSYDITVRITADNGGKPSTSSLASATLSPSTTGTTPSWVNVSFPNPTTASNGTIYWIVLDYGSSSSVHYWNWRKDTTNAYANNTGRYTSNWSSRSASWFDTGGDLAFRVWIGGTNTRIENITIGDASSGTGRANAFLNTTIHGSACPNAYCIIDNPSREELPISDGVIQDWRDAAEAGGTCAPPVCNASGDYILSGSAFGTLGPIKVPGDLILNNSAQLTLTGTVWVDGNISLSNGCVVMLDSSYQDNSGVLLTDGVADVSNNCAFQGSGDPNSYIMLLSARNAPTEVVINISNNALGAIYYASNGKIEFSNGAAAKEATAYGIELENNAVITYESGLANVQFSSGPAGGWTVESWSEIVP